ncbi:MAG: pyridoxal phosphate-dependent aspartate aminotransferase [Gemmatimonadetes bacterium]|nr:pyridoxal phosphate-dependent aspartate aminotransferase [Gemmatimonadota bacterium]
MHAIPFFNYKGAFSAHEQAYLDLLSDIIRRGAFIQQRDLVEFEQHLAAYMGVKHAIGVGNATDGLIMAFRAVGLGAGDEVIFPSHTMVASPASAAHCGATPVPVDIGPDHLIDPAAIEAAITPRTRAILPVHLNGRTCNMDPILDVARRHGLLIIEDAAQALGSTYNGRMAGSFGKAAAISFYPAKILGCFGDGGAVVTNDDDVARTVRLLRDHGRNDDGEVETWGLNSRLDNFQAAVLEFQFKNYADIISHRRALAAVYESELGQLAQLALPPAPHDDGPHFDVYQNYELEADDRDGLRAFLKDRGIGTLIQWGGKAVHQFAGLGFTQTLPETDRFFQRCMMLPMNMMVTLDDARAIASCIREYYGA